MSAQAAKRRRSDAVNNRPGGLRRRATKTKVQLVSAGFGGKVSKTAKKSGGK